MYSYADGPRSQHIYAAAQDPYRVTSFTPTQPQQSYHYHHDNHPSRSRHRYNQRHTVQEIYIDDDDSDGEGEMIIIMRRAEPEVPVYYYTWLPYFRGILLIVSCGLLAIDIYTLVAVVVQVDGTIRRVALDFVTMLYLLYTFFGSMPIHHQWRRGLLCLLASLWWINTLVTVSTYSGRCEARGTAMCSLDYLATALSFLLAVLIVVEMHATFREYMLNKHMQKQALQGGNEGGGAGYELSQRRREERMAGVGASTESYRYDRQSRNMRSHSRASSVATLPVYECEANSPASGAGAGAAPTYFQPPGILPPPFAARSQQTTPPPPHFDEVVRSGGQLTRVAVVEPVGGLPQQSTTPPLSSPPAYPAAVVNSNISVSDPNSCLRASSPQPPQTLAAEAMTATVGSSSSPPPSSSLR